MKVVTPVTVGRARNSCHGCEKYRAGHDGCAFLNNDCRHVDINGAVNGVQTGESLNDSFGASNSAPERR